jgi:hypothetical protein
MLTLPAEIRLCIYRELLLPTRTIYFGSGEPVDPIDAVDRWDPADEWEDEDDDEDDLDLDDDSMPDLEAFDSDSDVNMRGGWKEYITAKEAKSIAEVEREKYIMHPAILCTNRQIYSEASSLLYTEGVITVESGDIVCLARNPYASVFGVPYHGAWRHNPLHGLGNEIDGVVVYDTAKMSGKMDPHVFARFRKVRFDASFDFEHTQAVELWIDDETFVVRKDDAERFTQILKTSTVMKDFVELISQSPIITSLEISLEVEVMVNSNLMNEEMLDDMDSEAEETEFKIDKLMEMGDERAVEIFLDSGICDPLKELSNVKNFNFGFAFDHREEKDPYEPLPKHVALIEEMKAAVEKNFNQPVALI